MWSKIIGFHNDAAGRQLTVLQDVYKSESDTNQRNQAIGALMLAYGYIKSDWRQAVDLYTRQCSIGVNAKDLATMAATLAAGGKNPVTGEQVHRHAKGPQRPRRDVHRRPVRRLGQVAVPHRAFRQERRRRRHHRRVAGKFGIAVVSPPLDDAGNSVRAQRAIADISNALGGNPYAATTAAPAAPSKASFEIYGFAMLDIGHDFKQINPNWSDTLRVTSCRRSRISSARTTTRSPACVRAASASARRRRPTSAT